MYPKLKLVNYGFQWRQDPFFLGGCDDTNWFLVFEKINIMCVKLFSKENFCDNCNSKLSLHYTPIKTKRFIKTFKCNKCGLIQSIPQSYFKSHPKPSMSVDADRSSIMYTKKRFLPRNIKLFRKFKINFNKFENILDIGANRGSFVQYVRSKNKKS